MNSSKRIDEIRRRLLKLLLLWPMTLAASRVSVDGEYIVIDGWVMKRTDLDSKNAG